MRWYLPDQRWWLRLITIPLMLVALAELIWWCAAMVTTWSWNLQVPVVAVLWLVSLLPNECQILVRGWSRQRRRAAALCGKRDTLARADLTLPPAGDLTPPVTWKGFFPTPDLSLAEVVWQLMGLIGAIGSCAVCGALLIVTLWFSVTGHMATYGAYLHTLGIPITPVQIALVAGLLFPFSLVWVLRERRPERAIPFHLSVTAEGVTWQPQGHQLRMLSWAEMRSFEVSLPPHDPALLRPTGLVFALRGKRTTLWWYDAGQLRQAASLIVARSAMPLMTLDPDCSTTLPPAWHILSRRTADQVVAGYLLLIAAAVTLVPPTGLAWLDIPLREILLVSVVAQLAMFAVAALQATSRYRRIMRHPLTAEEVVPPPPPDDGATYEIDYQASQLGRLLTLLTGVSLAEGLLLYILWIIRKATGAIASHVILTVLSGCGIIPLSMFGALTVSRAIFALSRRYRVQVSPDAISLWYLGRLGRRKTVLITRLAWAEAEQLLIRVREGRVGGFRVIGLEGNHLVPWPALRGRCVRRLGGGPPITARELAALVALRSGHAPVLWDQTGQPDELTQWTLSGAALITRGLGIG